MPATSVSLQPRRRKLAANLFGDLEVLRRKWSAALKPGQALPPFEEIMLGSLGRLADHIMLLQVRTGDAMVMMHAGHYVRRWLGTDANDVPLEQLPADCVTALRHLTTAARTSSAPASSTAYRVRDGAVETYDVLALPLANRWGAPLVALYVCERGSRFDLVDSIYRSTDEGMIALAALRHPNSGTPVDFQILDLNESAARLLATPAVDLRWRKLGDLANALSGAETVARLRSTLSTGRREKFELRVETSSGSAILRVGATATGDLVCATLSDVTEIKRSEESFRLLFENNPMPMWVFEFETLQFLNVNHAALQHYGFGRDEFLGMRYSDLWPEGEYQQHLDALRALTDAYQSSRSWHHRKADGEAIEVVTFGRRVTFDDRAAYLVTVMDITERRRAEARIAYLAHHDALTELPNRMSFHEQLSEALGRARRDGQSVAVLWVDLDHFKAVNDSFGHSAGDRLLHAVAGRLKASVGDRGRVARIGGDEFAVLLEPVASPGDASAIAERMIETFAEPYERDGSEMRIGASIGIAVYPGDGENADELMRNADLALYRAKAEGRGTHHFFEPEMDRQAQNRRALEHDLRLGLTRGEFELYYQPLIDLQLDRVVGFEALLRWNHPIRGMVPPSDFVSVAEETGMIVPLGEWVLQTACAEAAHWPADIKIAVNLSPLQFRSRSLVGCVVNALARSGLSPERLELEITESVLLAETFSNLATLHRLRELGVRISMDDFGTGYSSLGYLRSFPFDKIKIDRSFVTEIAQNEDCVAIIRAISGLGRSLRIRTTAEGVETAAQLRRLRDEGCSEVQGYYFSPPRPASEVAGLLAKFGVRSEGAPAREVA